MFSADLFPSRSNNLRRFMQGGELIAFLNLVVHGAMAVLSIGYYRVNVPSAYKFFDKKNENFK